MQVKLLSPCTYQGAKQRLAKQIVDHMLSLSKHNMNTHYYDLCCGSGAITIELLSRKKAILQKHLSGIGIIFLSIMQIIRRLINSVEHAYEEDCTKLLTEYCLTQMSMVH